MKSINLQKKVINISSVCLVLCLALVFVNFYITQNDALVMQKVLDKWTLSALIFFTAMALILWLSVDLTPKPTAKEAYIQLCEAHIKNTRGDKIKRYVFYFVLTKIFFGYFACVLIYQCWVGKNNLFLFNISFLLITFFFALIVQHLGKRLKNKIPMSDYPELKDLPR